MPFKPKKDYTATNQTVDSTAQAVDANQSAPLSRAGFNAENVDGVSVAPLNDAQNHQVEAKAAEIMSTTRAATGNKNINNLVCPTPMTGDIEESVARLVTARLWKTICDNEWFNFFTQAQLQEINNIASRHDYRTLMEGVFELADTCNNVITNAKGKREYDMSTLERVVQLSVLALCDCGFLLDNSGSMACVDSTRRGLEGEVKISRLEEQKLIVKLGAFISRLFDDDGIEVRTMTPDSKLRNVKMSNIKTREEIDNIFAHGVGADYGTPTADALTAFFNELILPKLRAGTMKKPYLIWLVTDGAPGGGQDVVGAIRQIRRECAKTKYGSNAVMIAASIVGEDDMADTEVTKWDKDEEAGSIVDCVSNYYKECLEIKVGPGDPPYDAMIHNIRMFTGPVIKENDMMDEGGSTKLVSGFMGMSFR